MFQTGHHPAQRLILTLCLLLCPVVATAADLVLVQGQLVEQSRKVLVTQAKLSDAIASTNTNRIALHQNLWARSSMLASLDQLGRLLSKAPKTEANLALAKKQAAVRDAVTTLRHTSQSQQQAWSALLSAVQTADRNLTALYARLSTASSTLTTDPAALRTLRSVATDLPSSLTAVRRVPKSLDQWTLDYGESLLKAAKLAAELRAAASAPAVSSTAEGVTALQAAGTTEEEVEAMTSQNQIDQLSQQIQQATQTQQQRHDLLASIIANAAH